MGKSLQILSFSILPVPSLKKQEEKQMQSILAMLFEKKLCVHTYVKSEYKSHTTHSQQGFVENVYNHTPDYTFIQYKFENKNSLSSFDQMISISTRHILARTFLLTHFLVVSIS